MRLFLLIFFILLIKIASAQSEDSYTLYSAKNGLSDNRVYSMTQDDRGFLWLATANGLNFFDGHNFKVYNSSNSGLKYNLIYEVERAGVHELLMATGYGIVLMDSRDLRMKHFTVSSHSDLAVNTNRFRHIEYTSKNEIIAGGDLGVYVFNRNGEILDSICADFKPDERRIRWFHFTRHISDFPNGDALISTLNGHYLYDSGRKKLIPAKGAAGTPYELPMHLISSRGLLYVYEISPEGHIFFIDNARVADSLFIFDMTNRKLNAYPLSFRVKDNIRWDSRIFFHRKNVFTISTSREGYFEYVYHPASAVIEQISARNAENYLARYVFQDHTSRYWIGTDAGLIRTMSLGPQITNIPVEPYVKKDKYVPVSSVYYSSGRWWVSGFSRESGLLVFDSVMQFIRKVDFEKSPDRNFILSVSDWNADSLLIGTKSGAWLMNTKTYQAEPFFPGWSKLNTTGVIIETAFRDSKGILWLSGGQVGGVWKIDQEKKSINHYKPGIGTMDLPVRSVSALAEDSQGNLLMTHWMDGLVKWNRKSGQFELVIKNFPFSEIKNYGCSGIAMGEDDQLWMYVNFYGLVKYNLRDHSFQRMVAVNDQAEDDVDCLTITNRKKIWVTLRHSMLIYDILSGTHYKLTAKNGLPDRMNTAGRLFYSSEKQIAATGFTNTITLIDLQSAERFFPSSPVHITGVYSFREKDFLPLGSSFNLRHRNNDLQVNFSIPDLDQVLSAPVYEYRLSRGDEWKFVGSTSSLQLSNLAAGNYNVEIRMANDSKQNVGASAMFSFSIVPPFHRTVWFYLLAAGFTFFLAYIIYRIRHNQQAALNRVRKNISTDLHDEIGSRLTHIRVLSTLGENMGLSKEEREIHLKKISDEALSSGNALDEIVQNLLMTKETLEDLPALMRHYAGDIFPNSYPEVTFIIPENAGNGLLKNELKKDLFLVFKEILNNIQKHAGATEVRVEMNESGRVLELVISDNGRGFNPELDNRRNGLKNIKSRIQKWKGKFMIHSSAGKGTEIGIALPIHKKSYIRRMFKKNHFA